MKTNKFLKSISLFIFIIILFSIGGVSYADWQSTLQEYFDIVETFDNLEDWTPSSSYSGDVINQTVMPKYTDGSQSRWTYYSLWGTNPGTPMIANFGTNSFSGKSAKIDYNSVSRLGLFFGSDRDIDPTNSGYYDVYIFHRTKLPKNILPTYEDGSNVGYYVDGDSYNGSWIKFDTFNLGCVGYGNCTGDGGANYGSFHYVNELKQCNYDPINGLGVWWNSSLGGPPTYDVWTKGQNLDGYPFNELYNLNDYIGDKWWGIEYRLRSVNENGSYYTYVSIWIYDENGNQKKIMSDLKSSAWSSASAFKPWNNFMFGGNNSNTFIWGPTMSSAYFVDDLIIDDNQIGSKYFQLVNGTYTETIPPVQNFRRVP